LIEYRGRQCIFSVNRDISSRKKAEQALRESEERLRLIFEMSVNLICVADIYTAVLLQINPAFTRMLGYAVEELLNRPFLDFVHPDDRDATVRVMREKLQKGEDIIAFENRYRCRDGSYRWLHWTSHPILEKGISFAIAHDITERKKAEEDRLILERQIQQTQKLESLGVLAGGIAHDFNNLLVAIMGNAEMALDELPEHSPARESIDDINHVSRQAADLCRQMLAYSGKGSLITDDIDLNIIITEILQLLRTSITPRARVQTAFQGNLPAVHGDSSQIRQVIMNIVLNASEAIENNDGIITVTTGVAELDTPAAARFMSDIPLPPGRYVMLRVEDTGCGMDEDTRAKMFEPFFTTKFTGRGLGMSAVLGIVKAHHGGIRIESEPGTGTRITTVFPIAADTEFSEPAREPEQVAGSPDRTGPGEILLVEDESSVRNLTGRMLEKIGYRVRAVRDGETAVKELRCAPESIACVLLDLTMPGMDGWATLKALRAVRPDIRVILTSGYAAGDIPVSYDAEHPDAFLQKPYNISALKNCIRSVLQTRGSS